MSDVNRNALLDQLRERRAAEAASVQLYDAAIAHARDAQDLGQLIDRLVDFRRRAADHVRMLGEVLARLGADPDARSTAGDVGRRGVAWLIEVCRHPDASAARILHALLAVELLDLAGWDILCEVADAADLDEGIQRSFRLAREEERAHIQFLRRQAESLARDEVRPVTGAEGLPQPTA